MTDQLAIYRPHLGVTVMPEWFQCEGIDAVLDRLQATGVSALATSPYLLEIAPQGQGAREPPPDGDAGAVRPLDRALWGHYQTWIRTAPSFVHDRTRYRGLRYEPSPPGALTLAQPRFLDAVLEASQRRGIRVYLQVMAASPPGYRVQFSSAVQEDQCLGPDGVIHGTRVDGNASLASPYVRDYGASLLTELAQRYPEVHGFRIDWPEYPPYDLRSALFDFGSHAHPALREQGVEPTAYGRQICSMLTQWQVQARKGAAHGITSVRSLLAQAGWDDFFSSDGAGAPLWASKRASVGALLRQYRQALDQLSGPRRTLEPQVFPAPLSLYSGFDWSTLAHTSDAVGVKLYTMHWPMIARFWARDLVGSADARVLDVVTAAMAEFLGFCDEPVPDGATLHYPSPATPHPVGARAQARKIMQAQHAAGTVPVIPFAHSYGPVMDVHERTRTALQASAGARLWVNRYGYLSDAKLENLASLLLPRMRAALN